MEMHQQRSEILSWDYPDFIHIIDEYTRLMKERSEQQEEQRQDQEQETRSKMNSMSRQYNLPHLNGSGSFQSMTNFPNLSNFKF